MNETISVIKQRRSIRRFDARQITMDALNAILEAALYAPSATNQQKWHFSVVQNKAMLKKMVQITKTNKLNSEVPFLIQKAGNDDYHTYYHAPTVVIVSGDQQAKFIMFDCAAAAQNIALAAASLGIGSCIMTSAGFLFASEEGCAMKKELGIPEGYEHVCSIAMGYHKGDWPATPPRNKKEVFSFIK
ncbi:MAG: nitroreductase family protein [Desulfobacteraceae bacterium]|jgi:nitroreductase